MLGPVVFPKLEGECSVIPEVVEGTVSGTMVDEVEPVVGIGIGFVLLLVVEKDGLTFPLVVVEGIVGLVVGKGDNVVEDGLFCVLDVVGDSGVAVVVGELEVVVGVQSDSGVMHLATPPSSMHT